MQVSAPYYPSVASHTIQSETMLPKTVGSTWLYNYDGKLWPVVLCDDETPPAIFTRTKPSGYMFPAILLGKHIYIWVPDNRLREFDPHKDYLQDLTKFESDDILETDSKEVQLEKTRRKAFVDDAVQFETPAFWKNYIDQRSQARKLHQKMSLGSRKRSRDDDDDDVKIVAVRRRTSTSSTSSKKHGTQHGANRTNGKTTGHLPTPGPTPVKGGSEGSTEVIKSIERPDTVDSDDDDLFVRQQKSPSDPFVDSDEQHVDMKYQKDREKNVMFVQRNPPGDEFCTIFVGKTQTPFSVPKNGVGCCDFLSDRVVFTEELRSHIDLDHDTNVSPKAFLTVAEYLQKGEFTPRLIDSGTRQHLEQVVLSEEMETAAANIAQIYYTASKIQFAALQLLCVNKLRALYPLAPRSLMVVIMVITKSTPHGCQAENELQEWLVDHMAEKFWMLVATEGSTFARQMASNLELRARVMEKLGQNPDVGIDEMDLY